MNRPELIAHLGLIAEELLSQIPDGLTDEDAAHIIAAQLDRGLTWDGAPEGLSALLEAIDGPALVLLVLGCIRVARGLPDAVERAQERVQSWRERREDRREVRHPRSRLPDVTPAPAFMDPRIRAEPSNG